MIGVHICTSSQSYEKGLDMKISARLTPTTFLVCVNLLVYLFTSVLSGNLIQTSESVLLQLGQFNLYVINGLYWQLLTSIFVHVDIIHFTLNMVFLLIFGFRAEDLFSHKAFFVIYLLSGFLGNVLTLLLMHPWTLSAGASGAIFGIFGACVIYLRKALNQSILSALVFSGFLLLLTSGGGNVNVLAHFGGLVAGLLIGYILARADHRLFHTNYWVD